MRNHALRTDTTGKNLSADGTVRNARFLIGALFFPDLVLAPSVLSFAGVPSFFRRAKAANRIAGSKP